MSIYKEARVRLINMKLNKLKSVEKNKKGTILRLNKKKIEDEGLPHKLFVTTRQANKIRNGFLKNMSLDIKRSKVQMSKIIESGGSVASLLGSLGTKTPTNIAICLSRNNLLGLVCNLTKNAVNKLDRKINWKGALWARKRFTLFISNEDINGISQIIT